MSRSLPPVVTDYFEAGNRHDAEAMAACWKPGGTDSIPAHGITLVARDGLRDLLQDLFTSVPDIAWDIQEYAVGDGLVAVRSVMSGTHRGSLNGVAGTGRRFEVDHADFYRFEGDQIISNHVIVDGLTMLRQLGVLPPLRSRREAALRVLFNGGVRLRRLLGTRRG